ncbi:NUDIX domain-containing protein [Aurantimonas endophytica]|uniref:8-oxo-dGTP diphosphatase n=1 Tax=Aurantimonas endophytica TaxID=1522175 RepID=A0A7W6HFX9_9HYPH|nr:NUDIX domain-containing protein [Aurantimonas endophytica]MBB4004306.1 8-oxo-dGTP diphosphatase [Aurantimonas endophytica]MCO6405146.1 NUDIX domain-containing protein [Aurantimonas endophytica]
MLDRPTRPLLGVSVCLSRAGRILLVERRRDPYAGRLSLPGGGVDFGERLEVAARREMAEETGLTTGPLRFVTLHEAIGGQFHAVIAVFAGALPFESVPQAGDDAARLHLLTLDEIEDAERVQRTTPGLGEIVEKAVNATLIH